jgi:hypothetical protein
MPLTWVRVVHAALRIIVTIMKRRALQRWMGRVGLLAALLLLLVPTTGRLLQAAANSGDTRVAYHAAHAGQGQAGDPRQRVGNGVRDVPPSAVGTDCDYCALLAALAVVRYEQLPALTAGGAPAVPLRNAVRLPWVHPNGLGSRGPPAHG